MNNAARLLVRPLLETSDEDWHAPPRREPPRLLLRLPCRCPALVDAGNGGRIVNVSSAADVQPLADLTAYISAKGGIVGLTRTLALELAYRTTSR